MSLESNMDDKNHINFDAPATLRKWPSIKNQRASATDRPYLIVDGTLDDCIRQFMAKPVGQHHLYEIHTAPQGELVSAVLSAKLIPEIARDFYKQSLREGPSQENMRSAPVAGIGQRRVDRLSCPQ